MFFAYMLSVFQHPGEYAYNATTGTGTLNGETFHAELMSAISSNWGDIKQQPALGCLCGLPVVRMLSK